jgi:hypothetical protein
LNELLDSKNEQLRNKEAQIDAMRQQMQQQSEHDALEIAKLRQQMSLAAGTTLAKLNEIVIKNEHAQNNPLHHPQSVHAHRYEQNTREELSRALDEKDQVIRKQESALQA